MQDACQNGDLDKIKDLILQEGLEVNEVDDDGYTPTMIAATRGYANIVEYLISQRGDPNVQVRLGGDTHGGVPSELVRAYSPPSPQPVRLAGLIGGLPCTGGPNCSAHGRPVRPYGRH